jgi:hypothetical protein
MESTTNLIPSQVASGELEVRKEIDPEKTIADARIASLRLTAIVRGHMRQFLIRPQFITAFGFLGVLLAVAWFIYKRLVLAVAETYLLVSIGVFALVAASGIYLFIKQGEKERLWLEASGMRDEIDSLIREIEQIEQKEEERYRE